jgi:small-conductance mechanosensitive channel
MLTFTIPKVSAFANGMKILDMMPEGYDIQYVNTLFAALGENGRDAYLYNQIPLDLIFPALFGIGYCLLFAFLLKKLNQIKSPFFYFSFLPLIAGISDYLENTGIITMLNQYPNCSDETVTITSTFSFLKSSTTTIYFIALIFVLIAFGVQYVKSKRSETVLG